MSGQKKKLAVLMGGWTSEAEISRLSGAYCARAARELGWEVHELEFTRDVAADLLALGPQLVFNALHGQIGEDGSAQGMLNILNIPYTHSGVQASAMAMDKIASRRLFETVGISLPPLLELAIDESVKPVDYSGAYVVKPRSDGSSVGVALCHTDQPPRPRNHWPDGQELMGEVFIPGRELTVAVLEGKALCVTEIIAATGFYDWQAKYAAGGSQHILPAELPEAITDQALDWAERAFSVLGCRGVARADYRYDDSSGQLFMLEINTQPGMTGTSLVPEQAAFVGMEGPELVRRLLEGARCD